MVGVGVFLLVLALIFTLLSIFITSPSEFTPHEATTTTFLKASASIPSPAWPETETFAIAVLEPRTPPTEASRSRSGPRPSPSSTTTVARANQSQNRVATDVWTRLAKCESGNSPTKNTGNGYYGAFQFKASTWHSVGESGLPHQASYSTQLAAAKRLQARDGWGPWPACARALGLL